jgi:hypothetical protein
MARRMTPNPALGPSFEKALTAEVGDERLDSSIHHWFVFALLASILALVCAMTAAARSEGAPFLRLDTMDIRLIFGAWHIRQTVFDFGWRREGCPRLGLEGEQRRPDHAAVVRARRRRQDRPLADRDRLHPDGGFGRARADGGGRRLSRLLRNWHGFVSRIARQAGIGGRKSIVPIISSPGLDYRRQAVYARPGQSMAVRLMAIGSVAAC